MSKRGKKSGKQQAEEKKNYKSLKTVEEQPVRKPAEKKQSVKEEKPYHAKSLSKSDLGYLNVLTKETILSASKEVKNEVFSFTIYDVSSQILEEDMEALFLTKGFSVKARMQRSSDEKFLCCITCKDRETVKKAQEEVLGQRVGDCKFEIVDDRICAIEIEMERIDKKKSKEIEGSTRLEEKCNEGSGRIEEEDKNNKIRDYSLSKEKGDIRESERDMNVINIESKDMSEIEDVDLSKENREHLEGQPKEEKTIEAEENREIIDSEYVVMQEEPKEDAHNTEEGINTEKSYRDTTEILEESKDNENVEENNLITEEITDTIQTEWISNGKVIEIIGEEYITREEIVKSNQEKIEDIIWLDKNETESITNSIISKELGNRHTSEIKQIFHSVNSDKETSENYSDIHTIEYVVIDSPGELRELEIKPDVQLLTRDRNDSSDLQRSGEGIRDSLGSNEIIYPIMNSSENLSKIQEKISENEEISINQYIEYKEVDADPEISDENATDTNRVIEILEATTTEEKKYTIHISENEEEEKHSFYDPFNTISGKQTHTPEFKNSRLINSSEFDNPPSSQAYTFPTLIPSKSAKPPKAPHNSSLLIYVGTTVVILALSFLLFKKFRH